MVNNTKYTKLFLNCKAVFQGGGCKAVAYVGAYEEALAHGFGFSEFAGTSAGSIIAAFLSAGATVQNLKDFIYLSEFSKLILPLKYSSKQKWFLKCGLRLIGNFVKFNVGLNFLLNNFYKIIKYKGFLDSGELRQVIEEELRRLTGLNRTVKFEDLQYPLTIVASDIKKHNTKRWDNFHTPKDSVSYAVLCSCSVPFVFPPVDKSYLDGGLLSNLPVSFLKDSNFDFDRILAFTLQSDSSEKKRKGEFELFIRDLISTIVQGSTEIQRETVRNLSTVEIHTNLGLLDFDKLDNKAMVEGEFKNGATAIRAFIKKQRNYRKNKKVDDGILRRVEQLEAQVSYQSYEKNDEIIVSLPYLNWTWEMFLTIYKWKVDGTFVKVYSKYPEGDDLMKFNSQVRMLSHMGIQVFLGKSDLPISGYFFKKNDQWCGLLVKDIDQKRKTLHAKQYFSDVDQTWINLIVSKLTEREVDMKRFYNSVNFLPLVGVEESVVLDSLKSISHYKDANLMFEEVKLNRLKFITRYVLGYKYRAMDVLFDAYSKNTAFGPAAFIFAGSKLSLIGPPVIEIHDNEYIIINGNTRILYAYRHGIDKLKCVVVRNVNYPVISNQRFDIDSIVISDKSIRAESRYDKNWDYSLFRNIEGSVRPIKTYMK